MRVSSIIDPMFPDSLASRIPGGRRCIVSLCYDDALPCHFETVAPLLEHHDLRGTFYVPIRSRLLDDVSRWRAVAAAGHELGNHTIFHPCYDASWLPRCYHLRDYTPRRWRDEVAVANKMLRTIDDRARRTFGNTCHDNRLGSADNITLIETLAPEFFLAARGEHTCRPVDFTRLNWFNLGNKGIDGARFDALRAEIESLAHGGGWLIYTMHGVGPRDHELNIAAEEHRQLIEWLATQRERIWTAPIRAVAETLRDFSPARVTTGDHAPLSDGR